MKIVQQLSYLQCFGWGGAPLSAIAVAELLSTHGHEVVIALSSRAKASDLNEKVDSLGLRTVFLPRIPGWLKSPVMLPT